MPIIHPSEIDQELIEKLHDDLYYIMDNLIKLLEDYEIKYFVIGGTLLGAYRNNQIISHDDDIDIGMLADDYVRFKRLPLKVLNRYGLISLHKFHKDISKVYLLQPTPNIEAFIDIFKFDVLNWKGNGKKEGDYVVHYTTPVYRTQWGDGYFAIDNIVDLEDISFGPLNVKAPKNAPEYFKRHFGEDWKTPKITHSHLHEIIS